MYNYIYILVLKGLIKPRENWNIIFVLINNVNVLVLCSFNNWQQNNKSMYHISLHLFYVTLFHCACHIQLLFFHLWHGQSTLYCQFLCTLHAVFFLSLLQGQSTLKKYYNFSALYLAFYIFFLSSTQITF